MSLLEKNFPLAFLKLVWIARFVSVIPLFNFLNSSEFCCDFFLLQVIGKTLKVNGIIIFCDQIYCNNSLHQSNCYWLIAWSVSCLCVYKHNSAIVSFEKKFNGWKIHRQIVFVAHQHLLLLILPALFRNCIFLQM